MQMDRSLRIKVQIPLLDIWKIEKRRFIDSINCLIVIFNVKLNEIISLAVFLISMKLLQMDLPTSCYNVLNSGNVRENAWDHNRWGNNDWTAKLQIFI